MTDETTLATDTTDSEVERLADPPSDIDAMVAGIDVDQARMDFAKAEARADMLRDLEGLAAEIAELTAAVRYYSPKEKISPFVTAGAERLALGKLSALKARGEALADVLDERLAALEAEAAAALEAAKTPLERLEDVVQRQADEIFALRNTSPQPPTPTPLARRQITANAPVMCGGFAVNTPGPVRDLAAPRGSTRLIGREQAAEPLPPMLLTPKRHRLGGQAVLVAGESYGVD